MAVRAPLYFDGTDLKEMSTAMVDEWKQKLIYHYSLDPSVDLTVVASSGAGIAGINDTRLAAGTYVSGTSAFPSAAATPNVTTLSFFYDKINEAYTNVTPTSDTGTTFPVYYDGSNIRAMNLTDVQDTFLYPCIDLMVASALSANTAGTYHVENTTTYTGSTRVSATPVFTDTRANAGAYTASGIPETLDQPTTITNYYLFVVDGVDVTPSQEPVYIDGSNNLRRYTTAEATTLLGEHLREVAAENTGGYKINYRVDASATGGYQTRGDLMVDTKLNGSTYRTLQVDTYDYRSQEHPSGTATTINSYRLQIGKV